ncbi:MAG TPA: alpha/beta hydrolase [Jiangellales bacterium]|nr:alpha/beta hydrolase [Jiangellales bacterium]
MRLCTVQNPVRLSRATRVATESTLSTIANALPFHEFRAIYVDHRGVGRSDKPHERAAYAMRLRVADAVAVLDALGIQRAHFVGTSYGARLCFGIGEHAPRRVRSLVIGGQQPYRMDRHTALGRLITESLAASRESNTMTPFVDALEAWAGSPLPEDMRALWLDNDPAAIEAASAAMLDEGDVAADLASWSLQCVLFVGADDVDFFEGAQRAAREIPNADFVALAGLGDIGAHLEQDPVLNAVFRTLRADA